MSGQAERDVGSVRLPRWGRVTSAAGVVPWLVVAADGHPVEPIARFLRDFAAQGNRPASVRSYAYDLLRWWRWLQVVEVAWDRATAREVADFVLWLGQAAKRRDSPRTVSAATVGTINPITRKRYLGDGYEPRTVRHSNAVLRSFYQFWIERGEGPLVNPVALQRTRGGGGNAHHNPLTPFRAEGRIRYNPKIPRQRPRQIPDSGWNALFAAMRSNRDRALLALGISNAARACELLGIRSVDLDWGELAVQVVRKGSDAQQWLPASPEAFVWIRLYLADLGCPPAPNEPLWWTLRRRDRGDGLRRQPMNYEALRAVFRRANAVLGTNYSMHDLRHTCALRMARDEALSLRDVQTILGHAHLSTTAEIYLVEDQQSVIRRVGEYLAQLERRAQQRPPALAVGYDAGDVSVLLGDITR